MRSAYFRAMNWLYVACMLVAGLSIVAMALIIAWGVYTRYILAQGSFWAEPIAIMLAVQMTFYGAAACYRANAHISIDTLARLMPLGIGRRSADHLIDVLMLVVALAMIFYGWGLVRTTYLQVYPEFQQMTVGAVYSAVPLSGIVTLLFVLERLLFWRPAVGEAV